MDSVVEPKQYVALRLSSDLYKPVVMTPNTTISLGKFGSFYSNQIIGRPFYVTYELLDKPDEDGYALRVVPAAELHAEALISEGSAEADGMLEEIDLGNGEQQPMRTNRDIVDSKSTQALTLDEIEELKKNDTGAGKDIIAKLLESHASIDKKTAFSLAKYKLRKERKYLRRFTVVPLDANVLTETMLERKEGGRIMELRLEMLGLLGCWGNVHNSGNKLEDIKPGGRYLVVDDTGGLVVAAMAERLGILYRSENKDADENNDQEGQLPSQTTATTSSGTTNATRDSKPVFRPKKHGMAAEQNTITLIHPNSQPNLGLLKYFGYEMEDSDQSHPLFEHFKTVSWLQVVDPEADSLYSEKPETLDDETLKSWKPRQRGTYYYKHGRWARVKRVVDEVRAGGYDGLVVASVMDPESILKHAVPLLSGGAPVAVYSPTVEQLTNLMDLYSTARRTAYKNRKIELESEREEASNMDVDDGHLPSVEAELSSEFPLDPTALLAPMLQTSRVREWQVLPGRTHPLMSGRGGAEGYIFHGVRALPTTEYIQARGVSNRKRRKLDTGTPDSSTPTAA